MRECFHIDRGLKHLLHDVKIAFSGGKCSLTSHVCNNLSVIAIRRKIRRSFRFIQQWGTQFHDDFDFLSYYLTDDTYDINKFHINVGDDILDLDFHDELVVDNDPV